MEGRGRIWEEGSETEGWLSRPKKDALWGRLYKKQGEGESGEKNVENPWGLI